MVMEGRPLTLKGTKIILRTFCESDLSSEYLCWLTDPDVMRFSNQRFHTHTLESARAYLNTFTGSVNLFLGVWLAENNRLVGTITAYYSQPHETADIGLMIGDRDYWGMGIGLDAWSVLLNYLLNICQLRKVTGGTLRCNVGMMKIMERSGMQIEAVRAKQELVDQIPQDVLYYAKFRPN